MSRFNKEGICYCCMTFIHLKLAKFQEKSEKKQNMMTAKIESPPTEFQICIEKQNFAFLKTKRSKFTINLDRYVFRNANFGFSVQIWNSV